MLLVVDTNILFTFFWKDSSTKDLLTKHKLFAPELSLSEINKYSSEIILKTGISKQQFSSMKGKLLSFVEFVPIEQYKLYLKEAESLSRGLSKEEISEFVKDVDFFALALKFKCPIWSNDKLFKKQSVVDVFNTREIIELSTFLVE